MSAREEDAEEGFGGGSRGSIVLGGVAVKAVVGGVQGEGSREGE